MLQFKIAMTRKRVINLNNYEDKDKLNKQFEDETVHRSRRKKKDEEKEQKRAASSHKKRSAKSEAAATAEGTTKNGKKKKYKMNWKQFIKFMCCAVIAVGLVGVIYVAVVISKAPEIDTSNIYSMLSQSSILYDDEGKVIDSIFGADVENRTIV